jgi:succinate-semialdehyde dehydrogenase/glutarate-semialdehyde dehydrogenase
MFSDTFLFIDGVWRAGAKNNTIPVYNPSTTEQIGLVAKAEESDLDIALEAAQRSFNTWRSMSAFDRSNILRTAAKLLRDRVDSISRQLTLEQGKPLVQSRMEIFASADLIEWFAEEGRRTYGRIVPSRLPGVMQFVHKEPIGPVAAFSPWNFPVAQAVRKIAAALAAGCSIIIKAPEETPNSPAALVECFANAGLPDGVLNLVFGIPEEISNYLIPNPIIKKVSFTGSTTVGKTLAALCGLHMKRSTMELGGHGPAIIFDDIDIDRVTSLLVSTKFRNAGQVCISPTRFLIHKNVFHDFVGSFVEKTENIKVGCGLSEQTDMGPLANERRVSAMQYLIKDALDRGAVLETGGSRIGNVGNYFQPTVITGAPVESKIMNNEPFGPVALLSPFSSNDEVIREANRTPYGLASYFYTRDVGKITNVIPKIETGNIAVNYHGIALPEVPFGGIKDSGYGSEGGVEGIEAYLNIKYVCQAPDIP